MTKLALSYVFISEMIPFTWTIILFSWGLCIRYADTCSIFHHKTNWYSSFFPPKTCVCVSHETEPGWKKVKSCNSNFSFLLFYLLLFACLSIKEKYFSYFSPHIFGMNQVDRKSKVEWEIGCFCAKLLM